MKQLVAIFFSAIFFSSLAHARMQIGTSPPASNTSATPVDLVRQSGRVGEIRADAGTMVVGGVTYAYNPLSTKVIVNGKRATISDVRKGTVVQFEAVSKDKNTLSLLTTVNMQILSKQNK
ncbi:MAG: hypothetical protein WAT12_02720 [Candidatus Nitrotoga sp.]